MGRVKTSRHKGHVREDLRHSISLLRSSDMEGSGEDMNGEGEKREEVR